VVLAGDFRLCWMGFAPAFALAKVVLAGDFRLYREMEKNGKNRERS